MSDATAQLLLDIRRHAEPAAHTLGCVLGAAEILTC